MLKRTISFTVCLLMIVALLAVPAAASVQAVICPDCSGGVGISKRWDEVNWGERSITCVFGHSSCRGDYPAYKYSGQKCNMCGQTLLSNLVAVGVYCPVQGNYRYL